MITTFIKVLLLVVTNYYLVQLQNITLNLLFIVTYIMLCNDINNNKNNIYNINLGMIHR